MTYCPDVSKAFNNRFKISAYDSDYVVDRIEKASAEDAQSISEDKSFVIEKRDGSYFKLLSADYLRKNPKGKLCPTLELIVKDNEEGGSLLEYNVDLQKNPIAILSVVFMTVVLIGAFIWLICALFVDLNIVGIVLSLALIVLSGMFLVKKALSPVFGMIPVLSRAILGEAGH